MQVIPGIIASSYPAVTNSYESIATFNLSSTQTSVTFSSIPSTYKHLQIRTIAKDAYTTANDAFLMSITFNGDTGANYSQHALYGTGSSAAAAGVASQNAGWASSCSSSGYTYSNFAGGVTDILDYTNTNKYKTFRSLSGNDGNGAGYIWLTSGAWLNTSAITSITISSSKTGFVQYSSFALYGVKG